MSLSTHNTFRIHLPAIQMIFCSENGSGSAVRFSGMGYQVIRSVFQCNPQVKKDANWMNRGGKADIPFPEKTSAEADRKKQMPMIQDKWLQIYVK